MVALTQGVCTMKKLIILVVILLVGLLGAGVWLSAQRDMDRDPDGDEEQPNQTTTPISLQTEYRGVNITLAGVGEHEIEMLATDWNANLVRVRLASYDQCDYSVVEISDPSRSNDPSLQELDKLISTCNSYGLRVVIDLHQFPGYSHYDEGPRDYRLWDDPALQERFIRYWRGLAARYAEWGDVIYGYDLLNEPCETSTGFWLDLAERTARAIREVDSKRPIIIESRCGTPATFAELKPIDDPNVIYSVHLWEPVALSLQGHLGNPTGVKYPSDDWNKDYLREVMRPVVKFQQRYGVPIFVGEFGASTYMPADSRVAYLEDVLSLLEEYGYDHALSQYRESGGISLEHIGYQASWGEIPLYVGLTEGLSVFKKYLGRNTRSEAIARSSKPVCLFDRSHWRNGLDTNVLSLDYAWRLTAPCDVYYHSSGEISAQVLEGIDLLVTGNSEGLPYLPSEIEAIVNFVRSGGAFLCYQGTVHEASLNQLLSPFGIRHDPTVIFSQEPAWVGDDGDSFWLETFDMGHPAACHSCSFNVAWGGSLFATPPAVAFAMSEADTWKDANQNGHLDTGEEQGPFGIIAASELGEGRAVVVADETLLQPCNWSVMRRLVDWLLEGAN
jgi:cellulase (glycosyl hydrolase family 5)